MIMILIIGLLCLLGEWATVEADGRGEGHGLSRVGHQVVASLNHTTTDTGHKTREEQRRSSGRERVDRRRGGRGGGVKWGRWCG